MRLSQQQLSELIEMVAATRSDSMGCDDCAQLLDRFVDQSHSEHEPIRDIEEVKRHLEQCKCCQDELQALLTAIDASEFA
jgi:hypothetical protein